MTQNKIYNQCIVGVENSTDRTDDTDQTLCLESQTAVLWRTGNLLRNIDYVEETLANSLDLNGTLCDLGINRYMYLRAKEDDQALVRSSVSLLERAYSSVAESRMWWSMLMGEMNEACRGIVMAEGAKCDTEAEI